MQSAQVGCRRPPARAMAAGRPASPSARRSPRSSGSSGQVAGGGEQPLVRAKNARTGPRRCLPGAGIVSQPVRQHGIAPCGVDVLMAVGADQDQATCGRSRTSTCSASGWPCQRCKPLSTPPCAAAAARQQQSGGAGPQRSASDVVHLDAPLALPAAPGHWHAAVSSGRPAGSRRRRWRPAGPRRSRHCRAPGGAGPSPGGKQAG